MKEKLTERFRWWLYHPREELIYLLGGVPKEHMISEEGTGSIHYRNVRSIVENIKKQVAASKKRK